jgi:hypothetical protein
MPAGSDVPDSNRGDRPCDLWAGLSDDQLVWLRYTLPDAWLEKLADAAARADGVVRFERPAGRPAR